MGGMLRKLSSCIIRDDAIAVFFPTEEKKACCFEIVPIITITCFHENAIQYFSFPRVLLFQVSRRETVCDGHRFYRSVKVRGGLENFIKTSEFFVDIINGEDGKKAF